MALMKMPTYAGSGGTTEWLDKEHYFSLNPSTGLQTFTNGQSISFTQNRPVFFNTKDYTQCLAGSSGFTAVGIGIKSDMTEVDISGYIYNRTVNVTDYDYIMVMRTLETTSQTMTFS